MQISRNQVELWRGAISPAWTLTSDVMQVTIADLGAHLVEVVLTAREDNGSLLVPYPAGAATSKGYHGASVGRYANRIAGAAFVLDDVVHDIVANEGDNQLHGGPRGWSSLPWTGDAEAVAGTARVELHLTSPDGDQGYPGSVGATAIFEVTESTLTITYLATPDAATPINLTNHAYWNLGDTGSLDGHELSVTAAAYVEVDEHSIPVAGPPALVEGTRFDCRAPRDLGEVVAAGGYDHSFVLDQNTEWAASLRHVSGRSVTVSTNQVGLQVYTGQHLAADARGVALETQCHPDTPNRPDLGDCVVRAGETYRATTTFELGW